MKLQTPFLFALLATLGINCSNQPGTSNPQTELPSRMQAYFENYCDHTGSMGIGFVPEHTYDLRFRQQLKTIQDPETKRLFVLYHLHIDTEHALKDFQNRLKRIGKDETRPLTAKEWVVAREAIANRISDIETYTSFTNFLNRPGSLFDTTDIEQERNWIGQLRHRLQAATNVAVEGEVYRNRETDR